MPAVREGVAKNIDVASWRRKFAAMFTAAHARSTDDNVMGWIQKCDIDEKLLPIPTQIVSNEEFEPPDQTADQKHVENRIIEIADDTSKRLGISRRKFLASTGGMAAAFLAMNEVFGNFFDVSASEMFERQASDEKFPKRPFIFDIHTHQ